MSNAIYKKNPHRIYYIRYSYLSYGKTKSGQGVAVNPLDEDDAISQVKNSLYIKDLPEFKAWVHEYKDW